MAKTELAFSGLMGAAEAVAEAAKHLQELEQRYLANESSFGQIQKQFQQMQDSTGQLHSIAEERLAALAGLNVELKARHAQGEQTLQEVRNLLDELKVQQARIEQSLGAVESRHQNGPEQANQYVQAVKVLETVVQQVQARQGQLEQAQVATEALLRDQSKKRADSNSHDTKGLAERQAQIEKALSVLQGTQQAEKGLMAHFEKSVNTIRTAVVELEKRQSQLELSLTSMKANGKEAEVIQQSVDTVRGLIQDLADRQAALQGQVDRAHEAALHSSNQTAQLEQQLARVQSEAPAAVSAEAGETQQPGDAVRELIKDLADRQAALQTQVEQACEAARRSADQTAQMEQQLAHLQGAPPAEAAPVVPVPVPENAPTEFQQFLQRCEEQYRVALHAHQAAVDAVQTEAEAAARQFFEAAHEELISRLTDWCQQQEERLKDLSSSCNAALAKATNFEAPEWVQALEGSIGGHSNELRFLKTLMWVTLAAVGLAYGLVAYAVILRS